MRREQALAKQLITPEYQGTLQAMHTQRPDWGASAFKFIDPICAVIEKHRPQSVLDYGCGKGVLGTVLHDRYPLMPVMMYDPGIPEYAEAPQLAVDMVCCVDVLEHIEPELIENVLNHIGKLTKKVAYFIVHTADCGHKLPDGRPAHILQQPMSWWQDRIESAFGACACTYRDTGRPNRFEAVVERL
jgi:2-polyprenyl-3-methyl-5-hydroxy-6-metoxy-1,4-benzoquinol methylase